MTDENSTPLSGPAAASDTLRPSDAVQPVVTRTGTASVEERRTNAWVPAGVVGLLLLLLGFLAWRGLSTGGTEQLAGLQTRLDAMDARIGQLEARPAPPDMGPLEQRVAAVERRPQPNLQSLEQRLAAVEQRPQPDLAPLAGRLNALETKPAPQASLDAAAQKQLADIAGRMDGIAARQDQLGVSEQASMAKLADQVGGLQQAVGNSVKAGETVAAQAGRASSDVQAVRSSAARLAQLQAAAVALESGQPLGAIGGAPPALSRFATQAPPTEASLRLSFDEAARAAHEAGQPAAADAPLLARMWDRAQAGVTVRQAGRVIAGDTVSGVLETARHRLEAGDLAGSAAALDGLSGPAAAAMAPWRAQAQSLLDARAALLTVAHS